MVQHLVANLGMITHTCRYFRESFLYLKECKTRLELPTLVENYVKKNRSLFLIAVLLTTLICNR